MKKIILLVTSFSLHVFTHSQQMHTQSDSVATRSLDSILIIGYRQTLLQTLPVTQGTYQYSGKKTERINLQQTDANLSDKTARQVFAKVPGIFVYDMDGSGNQINIAVRGLDPHRGWEFNTRKDGIITNSDMYGYPASHYSMPLESIDHIELVRGTGSLQYGAQFGGMVNYVTKTGDTTRPFSFESINTVGSYNLLSTFNAIGGKKGRFRYYAYINKRSRAGYRDAEHSSGEAESIMLTYEPSSRFSLRLKWSRSVYLHRLPGQMNDSMFHANPRQATRLRNYYSPDIHIPSILLYWDVTPTTKIQYTSSAVLGRRKSVMFDKPTHIADSINLQTFQFNNRQVDIDRFNSYTNELRVLHRYVSGKKNHSLVGGIQYMNNNLNRTQLGKGTTGTDYDLTLVEAGWGRDLYFKTHNIALFAENSYQLLEQLTVNAGARVEVGKTHMIGTIKNYPENDIPIALKHQYPLFGASFVYKLLPRVDVYGGWSQAYRSMAFKDIIPGSVYEKVDPNIKDSHGYNAEIGFRGNWKFLNWDVTGYLLQYNNRFGTLAKTNLNGDFYTFKTNIGNSLTKGLEVFVQGNWIIGNQALITVFSSSAFMDSRYTRGSVKMDNNNINIKGNKVESAPDVISRNGATYRFRRLSLSVLYSYTAQSYADALNTLIPSATGATGVVPAYGLFDFSSTVRISENVEVRINVNNVTNKKYFTKRPMFYPGPGIWPSEGIAFNTSLTIRI